MFALFRCGVAGCPYAAIGVLLAISPHILTNRYENEFEEAYDLFEVQRVLNNCFSYDLVPAPVVIEKALQACRRVNDYPTAVRTFEALRHKVENETQYNAYLEELKGIREELGIDLKEELYGADA